ncbi:MAG: hypothetical protein ACUVTW_11545 [Thermogutta sp.]
MVGSDAKSITRFDELKVGDRITVEHLVQVGSQKWKAAVTGTVVRTERAHHGLHFDRSADEQTYGDVILLELPDGELSAVTVDEFTVIRRAE